MGNTLREEQARKRLDMPWKETYKMDERRKFVTRLLQGDSMTEVCREFGISRKTGHKIYNRFMEQGYEGLGDRRRTPKRLANLLDSGIADVILKLKKDKPSWGAPKLRELLHKQYPALKPPAISTIHALLDRKGLVNHRKSRRGFKATGTYLSNPTKPNDLWCTDFKGHFQLGNKSLCYPLTITDQVSRYIFSIEAMERISEEQVIDEFRRIFKECGMPEGIRSDNGVPFATRGLFGLSKLAVYWLRLGIKLERIKPGNPQQNGRHERMHKTLKNTVTKPPASNILLQQERFDQFREEFNNERPHQALDMKTPSEVYRNSNRVFPQIIEEPTYPMHDQVIRVSRCGSIKLKEKPRVFISETLGNQLLGLNEVDDGIWQVNFLDYDLGYFDLDTCVLTPTKNPFSLSEI